MSRSKRMVKIAMRLYMPKKKLKYAEMNLKSEYWGPNARVNAYRITKYATGHGRTSKRAVEAVLFPTKKPNIRDANLSFRQLYERVGDPPYIVEHNSGSKTGTIWGIHAYHLDLGWAGCAYHFVIHPDGKIYRGRPIEMMGGHAYRWGNTIGVCFIGNYDVSRTMPTAQLDAGRSLNNWLHKKYPKAKFIRHRDLPYNSTSCPGKHFPFKEVTK